MIWMSFQQLINLMIFVITQPKRTMNWWILGSRAHVLNLAGQPRNEWIHPYSICQMKQIQQPLIAWNNWKGDPFISAIARASKTSIQAWSENSRIDGRPEVASICWLVASFLWSKWKSTFVLESSFFHYGFPNGFSPWVISQSSHFLDLSEVNFPRTYRSSPERPFSAL